MKTKIFYHYSNSDKLTKDNINIPKHDPLIKFKPTGFWLSDESLNRGWKNWCLIEEYNLNNLQYEYEIGIDMTNILVINSKEKLMNLINNYTDNTIENFCNSDFINWKEISKIYKGIAFIPYNRFWLYDNNEYFKHLWYSTIDCDSACIWDLSAIISFSKPIKVNIEGKEDETKDD